MFETKRTESYFILYTVISVLLSIQSYLYFDKPLISYFHTLAGSNVELVFDYITEFGIGGYWIFYPGGIYFIYRLSKKYPLGPAWLKQLLEKNRDYRMQVMAFISLTTIASGLTANIFKLIFARYRPVEFIESGNFGFTWFDYGYRLASFPSGHSATALGVAMAFVLLFPRYMLIFVLVGLLIIFSRVVLTEHYLSDVLMGGYVGVITSIWLYRKMTGKGMLVKN